MEAFKKTDRYLRAKERVNEIKGFYGHLTIYIIMIPAFIWLNYMSTSFPWAIFPIVGWGIGLLGHAADVYGLNPFFGKDWEERKIREFMKEEEDSLFF